MHTYPISCYVKTRLERHAALPIGYMEGRRDREDIQTRCDVVVQILAENTD